MKQVGEYFKNKGCLCVEMEASAFAAACRYDGVEYFTFYYAGDNLDSVEWDSRSLAENVELKKKNKVVSLALELAILMDNE